MLDDYNPIVETYCDGQRYVVLAADHPAVKELADLGVEPISVLVIQQAGKKLEATSYAKGYEPPPVKEGNGGAKERRQFRYELETWQHVAQRQRRFAQGND